MYSVTWTTSGPSSVVVRIHGPGGSQQDLVGGTLPDPTSGEALFDSPGGEFSLDVTAADAAWTVTLTKV